jgi:flavin reductase (DIM6/NTAB) family NADH-FMN oxidoreductase RutF
VTIVPKTTAASAGMDAESYRALMRHQAGAVTVIAAGTGTGRAGLTATAVASLSDNPPTVLACVQRKSGAHDVITEAKAFSVNVLASDQQAVAERFAGRTGARGADRFKDLPWGVLKSGAPVLAGALASLDCELIDRHEFTTHSIFIGRVLDGQFRADGQPLLYFRGDYWDLGRR